MRVVRDELVTPGGWPVGWGLWGSSPESWYFRTLRFLPQPRMSKARQRQHVVSYSLLWSPHGFARSAKIGMIVAEPSSACEESNLGSKEPPWLRRVTLPVFRIQSEWGNRQRGHSAAIYMVRGRSLASFNISSSFSPPSYFSPP